MIRSVLGLLLANVAVLPLGAGLLLAAGGWRSATGLPRLCLTLLAGLAGIVAILQPLVYAGLSPTPPVALSLGVVVLAVGLVLDRRRPLAARRRTPLPPLAATAFAVPLAALAGAAAYKPTTDFDAYSNWVLRGKLLYAHGGVVLGALDARVFATRTYGFTSTSYPIGLPVIEALDFHFMGGADSRVIHLQAVILAAAFVGSVWALLAPHVPPLPLAAGGVLLLAMPRGQHQLLTGYADLPAAYLWVAAALAAGLWLAGEGDHRLWLAALLAAASAGVKEEGLLQAVLLLALAAGALMVVRAGRRPLLRLVVAATLIGSSVAPWVIYTTHHGLHDSEIDVSARRMVDQAGTLPTILGDLLRLLVDTGYALAPPLAVVFAVVMLVRRSQVLLAVGFLALATLSVLALATVYWNAAFPLSSLLGSSAPRTLQHAVVLCAACLPLLADRALRALSDDREAAARAPAGS